MSLIIGLQRPRAHWRGGSAAAEGASTEALIGWHNHEDAPHIWAECGITAMFVESFFTDFCAQNFLKILSISKYDRWVDDG